MSYANSLPPPAPGFLNARPAKPADVRRMMVGINIYKMHMTGPEARMLMRLAGTTIPGVAKKYGLTQARVRQVRTVGTSGYFSVCEWISNLCSNERCFNDLIHAEEQRRVNRTQPVPTTNSKF